MVPRMLVQNQYLRRRYTHGSYNINKHVKVLASGAYILSQLVKYRLNLHTPLSPIV